MKRLFFTTIPKRAVVFFALSIFLIACSKDDAAPEKFDPETTDERWMKLSIPKQIRGVSAIYGDIDDTLVVATTYSIYLTADKGQTWEMVHDPKSGISGFHMHQGELMAFSNMGEMAFLPAFFSMDYGKTWTGLRHFPEVDYDQFRRNRSEVAVSTEEYYKIEPQADAITDEAYGRPLRQPDKLIRVVNDMPAEVYFPFRRDLNYIYMDAKKRLYIGAEGTEFEWHVNGNDRIYPTTTDKALIYISREPADKLSAF